MDWSKLPDLGAVALLTFAFASVARRSRTPVSTLWLTGWLLVALHFAAFVLVPAPGFLTDIAQFIGLTALTWAGVLFMWSTAPYREQPSSRWMLAVVLGTTALYIGLMVITPVASWALVPAAALLGVLPLTVAFLAAPKLDHPMRWVTVALFGALSIFLLIVQHRPADGADLAVNAVLFTVYFDCCIQFWYAYRRASAGAFVTIAGFLIWASVFVWPAIGTLLSDFHVQSEVWNLPEYVVAVGMILLVLEEQIEHNRFLALHDDLTGLPNRRLFYDRLASALERARRSATQAALLLIDFDQFKQVNDAFGHHVGDLLLKNVGTMFLDRMRRSDTVARTGGDEYSIILEAPTNRDDAERVSQSLIQLLNEPLQLEGHAVHAGISVGIAIFPQDGLTMESLCMAADQRMYDEKRAFARRNRRVRPSLPAYRPAAEASLHSECS